MPSQSFTYFFTPDLHRATDRSQEPIWQVQQPSSSTPVTTFAWARPQR